MSNYFHTEDTPSLAATIGKQVGIFCLLIACLAASHRAFSNEKIVNVYAWTGEVPDFIIKKFEHETGIHINFSTYENNEIMYSKLRASQNAGYDVVMPSSYFVDRMERQGMLLELDKSKLPNWKNLDAQFLNPPYDPQSKYCAPFIWGTTGLFYNKKFFAGSDFQTWSSLWNARYANQLLLLDDTREVFAMALLSLGYKVNDRNPEHIKEAFLKLKSLMNNVKVFSTETVVSIMIDEDATLGMAWNGDAYKAMQENNNISFVYPKDGFVIWVDSFAIPKGARHTDEAHAFINFMLRPDNAKAIALTANYPTTNKTARAMLPEDIQKNQTIYPSKETLKRGQYQTDVGDDTLELYEKYWEELKMGG
jgi:spermidine/putrescine transport system substrate-binding protein